MSSELDLAELNASQYSQWDELVEKSLHGTIFHNSAWLTICSELLNNKLKIYGCFRKDQLIGGCSFYTFKKGFFKIASTAIGMSPYGGVVLAQSPSSNVRKQEQTYSNIIKLLCSPFDDEHFYYIRLINSPGFTDIRPFVWNGWDGKIYYAYYFNLEGDIEKTVSKNVRNTIRKAIKGDITIKKLNDHLIFYDLFSMTFKRQNRNPPVTKEFFEKIIDLLESKNTGEMWIAKTAAGEAVSAEIVIWDNKRAYRWAAASHTKFKGTGATSLLLYEIFQDLKNRGFKEINLMAANTPHLAKFVSSFNPKLVPYYSIEKKTYITKIAEITYRTVKRKIKHGQR